MQPLQCRWGWGGSCSLSNVGGVGGGLCYGSHDSWWGGAGVDMLWYSHDAWGGCAMVAMTRGGGVPRYSYVSRGGGGGYALVARTHGEAMLWLSCVPSGGACCLPASLPVLLHGVPCDVPASCVHILLLCQMRPARPGHIPSLPSKCSTLWVMASVGEIDIRSACKLVNSSGYWSMWFGLKTAGRL